MTQRHEKAVLFLCTGNYYRSRFAEILFNSAASKMGLPWRSSSRGLALERSVNNVGPMAVSAVKALEAMGLSAADEFARSPAQVTLDDLERADWIVALKEAEHLPLLQERFPAWAEKVEFWRVDNAPEALALIEREVMDLAARLIVGGKRRKVQEIATETAAAAAKMEVVKTSAPVVRLGRETKGRRGKGVMTVCDLPLDDGPARATALLERGGKFQEASLKDGRIEIQGDQRDRLAAVLESLGYRVKRVGG